MNTFKYLEPNSSYTFLILLFLFHLRKTSSIRIWQKPWGWHLWRHFWNVPEGLGLFPRGKQTTFCPFYLWRWVAGSVCLANLPIRPLQVWLLRSNRFYSALFIGRPWRKLQGRWCSSCPGCKGVVFCHKLVSRRF